MKRILTTLSSKWPEYLLEILVITIGILGAFALNNWNEARKDKKLLVNHLTKISENLNNDKKQLSELIGSRQSAADQITSLIQMVDNQEEVAPQFFVEVLLQIVIEKRFIPNQNGFDALADSEAFELVTNSPFYDLLFEYIRVSDELIFLEERSNIFSEEMENELWKNGFYNKVWPEISSYTKHTVERERNQLDYAGEFTANPPLQGLMLRSEYVFRKLAEAYQDLIEKGLELDMAIQELINETQ